MKRSGVTTLGSVIAAIAASLCCIGPIVVAIVGVGSIGVFSVFESYRPYFIVLTIILLGAAFFLTYRKHEVACEDGTCKIESAGKWSRITTWLATATVAVAIAVPYLQWTPSASEQAISGQSLSSQPMAVAVLNIEGMDCEACAAGLQATLGRIEGVTRASVEFQEGRAVLEYDPVKVQAQKFIDELDEVGFKATVRKEE